MSEAVSMGDLEKAADKFDWSYEFSDDHRYWVAGDKQKKELAKMISDLLKQNPGDEKKIIVLLNKIQLKHYKSPGPIDVKKLVNYAKNAYK